MINESKFAESAEFAGNHMDYTRYLLDTLEWAMDLYRLNPERAKTLSYMINKLSDNTWETTRDAVEDLLTE